MAPFTFINHFAHRYAQPMHEPTQLDEPHLEPRMPDSRPSRFAVGLPLLPALQRLFTEESSSDGPVLDPMLYLGRVEEIAPDGEVTARVWKVPSGQESIATLSASQLEGQEAHPGDSLRILTWFKLVDGERHPCLRVRVSRRVLNEEEQARLRALLDELRTGEGTE